MVGRCVICTSREELTTFEYFLGICTDPFVSIDSDRQYLVVWKYKERERERDKEGRNDGSDDRHTDITYN